MFRNASNRTTRPVTPKSIRRSSQIGRGFLNFEERLAPAVDLLTAGLSAPTLVAAGTSPSVQFAVVNVGPNATVGSFNDQIFLSNDAMVGNDTTLKTIPRSTVINPGQSYLVNTTATIPSDATGLKALIVVSDAFSQQPDLNRANNVRVVPLAVVSPNAIGPVTDLIGKVQTLIQGQLDVTGVSADGNSVTFDVESGQIYEFGGYRLTDVHTTVTVTNTFKTSVSANGTGLLHVPVSGANEIVVPVTFSATPTTITVDGMATLPTFRYGNEPALITAQNVNLSLHLVGNLTTNTVTGSVTFNAASARILATNIAGQAPAGPVQVTNISGTLSANGSLTATAAGVVISHRDFITITGSNASVTANINQTSGAVLTIASATATSPKFPGASAQIGSVVVNANGFSIGSINIAAPTINLPSNSQLTNFVMSVTNLAFNRSNNTFSVTSMTASASKLTMLGNQATINQINFAFNGQTGIVTATTGSATGSLGQVTFSGGIASLRYELNEQLPTVTLNTATVAMPINGNPANLTVTGFRLLSTGEFEFDALAGLTLPQLNGVGIAISGSFSGDVHRNGTTFVVHLQGQATVFGVPVRLVGDFTSNTSGLFGIFDVQSSAGGTLPVLNIGAGFSGEARIAVNATNVDRIMVNAGQTKTVAANTSWLRSIGNLMFGGFSLNGSFDLIREGDHWLASPTATLGLSNFGSFTVGGSFKVFGNGTVVGSMSLLRATGALTGLSMSGTYRLDVNTTSTNQDNITANTVRVVISSARFDPAAGMSVTGTFTIGVTNNVFIVSLTNANLSLWNGAANATVNGEIRSNGFFSLSGSAQLSVGTSVMGHTLSFNAGLSVSVSRSSASGAISFSAIGNASVVVDGITFAGVLIMVDQNGFVSVFVPGLTLSFML